MHCGKLVGKLIQKQPKSNLTHILASSTIQVVPVRDDKGPPLGAVINAQLYQLYLDLVPKKADAEYIPGFEGVDEAKAQDPSERFAADDHAPLIEKRQKWINGLGK